MATLRSFFGHLFGGESSKSPYETARIYDGLRKQILEFTAERLEAGANQGVLAVLMETGYPEAVATLAAVMDGSASLYFSNGGGIIGGGETPGPNAAARKLVAQAAEFESACATHDGISAAPAGAYPVLHHHIERRPDSRSQGR